MICRVHYINPEGRTAWKDVVAEKRDAEAVFRQTYGGVRRVERVEVIGGAARPKGVVREESRQDEAASDAIAQKVAAGLRAWREKVSKRCTP